MSEFTTISLKEFLLVKYICRPFHLFGWRFQIDPYYFWDGLIERGFWAYRGREAETGYVLYSLHFFAVHRYPHSERRKTAWAARVKARNGATA